MSEDLHQIDDLFKSGIEGKEETPSPAVWENIEKELDKKDSRPKFFYWWNARRIAAAVIILATSAGLFAGGYYLGIKKENKQEPSREKRTSPPVSKSASVDNQGVADQPVANENQSGAKPGAEGANTLESMSEGSSDAARAETINSEEKDRTTLLGNKTKGTAGGVSTKSTTFNRAGSKAEPGQVAADIQKNTTAAQQVVSKPSKSRGVTNNVNRPPVSSDRNRPVAASEKSSAELTARSADPVQNISAARTWEAETITAGSLSDALPETQKQIPVNKAAPVTAFPAPATQTTESSANKSIPVLNKRSSSVDLPRFSFTPVAGLQFGSNKIVATDDPHANHVKTDIDRTESQPLSISGGLLADLKIARNMTIQSGIVFTSRTIEIEPKYVKAERNPDGKVRYKFDCSAGTYYIKKSTYARPGDSALTIFSTNELNYINIPLALTYHVGGRKFSFFATAGAGLNLLTDQYLETGLSNYNYDEKESIATNLKSRYFNGMIGAGLTYRPFKKISFLFSPQYQFAVTPMNENMPVKAYPRIFNMQLGMQIRL
jgi:hypothetical protein